MELGSYTLRSKTYCWDIDEFNNEQEQNFKKNKKINRLQEHYSLNLTNDI